MTALAKIFRVLFILAIGFVLGAGSVIYYAVAHKNGKGVKIDDNIGAFFGGDRAASRSDAGESVVRGAGSARSNSSGNFAGSVEEYFDGPGPAAVETAIRPRSAAPKAAVRLLEFGAEWCAPCRVQDPIVAGLAAEYSSEISVVKIDIDKSPEMARRYGIQGVPTLILEKNGNIVKRFMGLQREDVLAAAFDAVLR